MVKQRVYMGFLRVLSSKSDIYFVLRGLIHLVLGVPSV